MLFSCLKLDTSCVFILKDVQKSTLVKDAMRVQCVNELVEAWYKILVRMEFSCSQFNCVVELVDEHCNGSGVGE